MKSTKNNLNNKRRIILITYSAIMLATALVLTYLENFLPPLFPGLPFRWGLSNIAVMFSLINLGIFPAIFLALGKAIFNLAWSPVAAILSLTAGLSSVFVMSLLRKTKVSLLSISILSALSHNCTQIILVSLLLKEFPIKLFLIPLLIISISTGFISATLLNLALRNIKLKVEKSTLVFLIVPVFLLTACSKKTKEYSKNYFNYFDTISILQIYSDKSNDEINELFKQIEDILDRENKLFDNFRAYDGLVNLYTLNQEASKSAVKVDEELFNIIKLSKELAEISNNSFTPMIGTYSSIWQKYYKLTETADNKTIINNKETISNYFAEISEARLKPELLDLNNLILDDKDFSIHFKVPGIKLDLGAVAKGYVAEKISALLKKNNIESAIINLGGNVKIIGQKSDGKMFQVGINNPYLRLAQGSHKSSKESELIEKYFPDYSKFIDRPNHEDLVNEAAYLHKVVCSDNQSVVSSGIYERFFFVNEERYSHLINPLNGKSTNKYLAISLVCDNSFLADAMSTALFNLSIDKGKNLIHKLNEKMKTSNSFAIDTSLDNIPQTKHDISAIWYNWDFSQEKEKGDIIKKISPQ